MKIAATDPEDSLYQVIDKDTNEIIKYVTWADDETGEYEKIVTDDNGEVILENGNVKAEIRKGNIRFEKIDVAPIKKILWLIGIKQNNDSWMCEGVFEKEEDAIANCKEEEFIVEVEINKRLPEKAIDALCLYWPHKQKKEDFYKKVKKMRERNENKS